MKGTDKVSLEPGATETTKMSYWTKLVTMGAGAEFIDDFGFKIKKWAKLKEFCDVSFLPKENSKTAFEFFPLNMSFY